MVRQESIGLHTYISFLQLDHYSTRGIVIHNHAEWICGTPCHHVHRFPSAIYIHPQCAKRVGPSPGR